MIRWVINPVDSWVDGGITIRSPRVSVLGYQHSTVVQTANWCLSFVRGTDFTALAADPECIDLLEEDYDDGVGLVDRTVGDLGWPVAKRQRVMARLEARGVDTSGYTLNTPIHRVLRDLARRLDVNLADIRALWVAGPGAPEVMRGTPRGLADDPGDTFVEASTTTTLTAHTPTGSDPGTGWTEEERTGTRFLRVNATFDAVEASAGETNARTMASLQPNPSGPEYDVQVTMTGITTITTCPAGLFARMTDASNYYAAATYRGADTPDKRLLKIVGGTVTDLGTADTGFAANDVLLLEIRDATKRLYKNGTLQVSSVDNALTSAGRCGIAIGSVWSSTDDIGASWNFKDFSYTMVAAANPEARHWPIFRSRMRAWA